MATKAGVGMSRHHNPNVAGREAAEQALEKAGVSKPDFVVMFGSIGYDQHSLEQVSKLFGTIPAASATSRDSGCARVPAAQPWSLAWVVDSTVKSEWQTRVTVLPPTLSGYPENLRARALAETVLGAVGIVDREEPVPIGLATRDARGPAVHLDGVTVGVAGR